MIFPYLSQYDSTPSLIDNPDTDSYQDTFSQFSPFNNKLFSDPFQTQTSTKDVSHDSTPKCQNLTHSPSSNDNLDNTFDSTDSDFEMLPNPIYYSNSSDNSFPQIYLHQRSSFPLHLTFTASPTVPIFNSFRPNISFPR